MYINAAPVSETTAENFAPAVRSHFPYWALYVPNNTRPMELPLHTRQHMRSSAMNPESMKKNPTVEMIIKSNELPRSSLEGFPSTEMMPCFRFFLLSITFFFFLLLSITFFFFLLLSITWFAFLKPDLLCFL